MNLGRLVNLRTRPNLLGGKWFEARSKYLALYVRVGKGATFGDAGDGKRVPAPVFPVCTGEMDSKCSQCGAFPHERCELPALIANLYANHSHPDVSDVCNLPDADEVPILATSVDAEWLSMWRIPPLPDVWAAE